MRRAWRTIGCGGCRAGRADSTLGRPPQGRESGHPGDGAGGGVRPPLLRFSAGVHRGGYASSDRADFLPATLFSDPSKKDTIASITGPPLAEHFLRRFEFPSEVTNQNAESASAILTDAT
ncbi:hypothetical protein HG15A2_16920 [Adhaeretor mobilis]|uniref:Uncharacterized protein n=1 Tax=Adhaeretor mobilis TaxID=1930276 RepID=A0A517MU54_9BACT|nr:hypothetical protein HG15A2_16920 [Adhaeretor mobilis]